MPIAGAPPRAFVIGWGEVGRRLGGGLAHVGDDVIPVTRSDGWTRAASHEDGLRVVCVREDDLPDEQSHFLELNAELCAIWPVISEIKEAPADADEWNGVPDKLQYLER